MLIRETVFSKQFTLSTKDPYRTAMDIRGFASTFGAINEKKNSYATDGPCRRLEIQFDIVSVIDDFCKVLAAFEITADIEEGTSKMSVSIEYVIETKTAEEGVFTEIFTEHYLRKYFKHDKEAAQKKIGEISRALEKNIQQTNKV